MTRPAFTSQQRAAIDARAGSSLLAANAGSGKTAVMVERIAAAVRQDEVPVSAILALTFTEKAAGELAERLRRRLTELGSDEHARAVDGAWIGTIHGFCARLLRSQPLAAGLDPRFEVLEASSAERLAGTAYERALERWARAEGPSAIDLAASYGPALRDLILNAYATLRARGHDRPRLTIPPQRPVPDPAPLARAREAALQDLFLAGAGARVTAAREALERCGEILAAAGGGEAVPWPARSTPPSSSTARRRCSPSPARPTAPPGAPIGPPARTSTPAAPSSSWTPCWTASAPPTTPPRPSGRRSTSTISSCARSACWPTRRRGSAGRSASS